MPYWLMYAKSHGPIFVSFYIQWRWFVHVCTQYMYPPSTIRSKEMLSFEDKYVILVLFYKIQIWLLFGL